MKKSTRYSPEVRERAVQLVFEHASEYSSQWSAIQSIAGKMGCTAETLRRWVRRAETDAVRREGLTTEDRARIKSLVREFGICAGRTRFCGRRRLFSPRRSSTAD